MDKTKRKSTSAPSVEVDADLDTRRRIKVASRRLFAERGVEAVTVREIVAAAGAKNGGSLNYYFRSKDGLIMELVSDLFRDNTDNLLSAFGVLERAGGPKSVRDVVAIIVSSFRPVEDAAPTAARFLSSLLFTRRRTVREFMERMHLAVYAKMLQYVEELRPDIPETVLRQRWIYFAWYMASAQSAHEAYLASGHRNRVWTDIDPIVNMIDTGAGLLEAPHSVPIGTKRSKRTLSPLGVPMKRKPRARSATRPPLAL